jgi:3-dehydrosphinganine reductase
VVDFHDQHIIITGGSSGIGRAMARLFAQRGAHVSILARRQAPLDETIDELEELRSHMSQRFAARSADVTDLVGLEDVFSSLMEGGYPVDVLINAAGIVHCGQFDDVPIADFYRTVEVDLYGTVNAVKAVVPTMKERQEGHIVNISSVYGFATSFGYTAYCAAKSGVRGFSDALRHDLKPYGIFVSCVFPQDTDTPQLHQEREMQPPESRRISDMNDVLDVDRVARRIVRGIERRRAYILPGFQSKAAFRIFNGNRLLTGLYRWFVVDRIVARVRRECEMGAGSAEPPEAAA